MIGLQTIAVAFAMFSALPVPQFAWNQKNMRYAMCAFPLIGVVIGGLWCLCGALPLPMPAKAAGFCLIPVWVTGGIHLDGYADTCDALSSYGDREKKLEILKDPHCGAFAVIRLCSYFAAYLALCACVDFTPRVGLCWTLALVLERALSGLAVASFPMAKNTGLAHTFATAADRTRVRRVLAVLCAVLADEVLDPTHPARIGRIEGLAMLLLYVLSVWTAARAARREQPAEETPAARPMAGWLMALMIVGGLAALVFGGEIFLHNAVAIARKLGVSESVIAITLVAGGTSLPELASSVVSVVKGRPDIALGNVVGSNIANILLILGLCSTVVPLTPGGIDAVTLGAVVLSSLLLFAAAFTFRRRALDRWEGVLFLAIYGAYLWWLLAK